MSVTNYNGYMVEGELTTNNSGFAKWGFAKKDGKTYFIKEFLSPVYPEDTSIFTEKQIKSKIEGCDRFEQEKTELYRKINAASDGNACRIEAFFRYGSKYYITMEKVLSMNLYPANIAHLPYEQRLLLCKVLAHTMLCLHESDIVHADMKWDNIIFNQSSGARMITAKIIDFDNSFFSTKPPTEPDELNVDWVYCAPEAFLFIDEEEIELTPKIDIFALGLIFHQIMTGELPEIDKDYQYVYEAQLDDSEVRLSSKLNLQMQSLIEGMIEKDPEKRLDAKAVFARLYPVEKETVEVKKSVPVEEVHEIKKEETPRPVKKDSYFSPAGDL